MTSAEQTAPQQSANLLGAETSPYLLQHRDNPVHWMPWGEAALARAQAEDRPILLSVGYAACHWCHVMAHESFEDPETAEVMNALFVPVKVDREERPDIDQIYQSALAMLGQPGGWPLTMFLTPKGEPFWGGTYFPPETRWGRPGFRDVLRGVAEAYRADPAKVTQNVTALREALERLSRSQAGGPIDPAILDQVAERLVVEIDPVHGGIGSAPKFPQTSILGLLWRAWKRTERIEFRMAVETTLRHMAQGGIYDHLGGGFARYSTDERWLVPHFEKMLYDNALLIQLMTLVWQDTRDPVLAARVRETVAWSLREMTAGEGGGFASTLDADSEGEEGRFYVWTEAEIDAVLGPDATAFKQAYDVTPQGNWAEGNREGATILNRLGRMELGTGEEEARLAEARERLLAARSRRVRPGWDDKVLADWNGLMITALAEAGFAFSEAEWIAAAERAFAFVSGTMAEDGRLRHSWRNGIAKPLGTLDDLAAMARAGLALFEVTGRQAHLDQAAAWVGILDQHHWDTALGGYFLTADDGERLIVRTKSAADSATPSGNGVMVEVLARLWCLTGEPRYRERAEALVAAFSGELARNFFPLATLMNGAELLGSARQIVIVGEPGSPDTAALLDAVRTTSMPDRVLSVLGPGSALPTGHPAHGKGMVGGRAAAYLCAEMVCLAPVTDAADLKANLTAR
ncbi:thioredoxin domain-containing protein [Arenibaculum pallidiluteum]|uniref:thioredoxin domain-containing protein n=1 Tax=Arenibaculum pallidiluteum TaxID=2812559 RepID=UPI001A966309|nr:thioredoxin domain-containing protein [Arenibaculum pallidiluteum]